MGPLQGGDLGAIQLRHSLDEFFSVALRSPDAATEDRDSLLGRLMEIRDRAETALAVLDVYASAERQRRRHEIIKRYRRWR